MCGLRVEADNTLIAAASGLICNLPFCNHGWGLWRSSGGHVAAEQSAQGDECYAQEHEEHDEAEKAEDPATLAEEPEDNYVM